MAIRDVSALDDERGRNRLRVVYDTETMNVYLEVTGNHDGVVVATTVRVSRSRFSSMVRSLGVL